MQRSHQENLKRELSGTLQSLMLLRVIFVSLLLGASVFIQIRETNTFFGYIQAVHYLLIAAIYFLTFLYVIIFKYSKNLFWLAYIQLFFDTLLVTAIIYTTGGLESIFSLLYMLVIINGSIMLYRKGGMFTSTSSSILYGLLLAFHHYHIIAPLGHRVAYSVENQGIHIFYVFLVNIAAFYMVAYLSSYLSEQIKKSRVQLKAKQIDIDKLEVLNQSIINSITSGLIALDEKNRIVMSNPAAEDIFGIDLSEVQGKRLKRILPFLSNYLADPELISIEGGKKLGPFVDFDYEKPTGEKAHLRLSVSPLHFPLGEPEGSILVFQDVTAINQIEAEMKKIEALALTGELAAVIAHEIRNPLASISGSIQMLREGLKKDDVSDRLMDIMSREIHRLNHLVSDFLIFARPKKVELKSFDLNALIRETLELFKNSQHWSGKITVRTEFHPDIRVETDPEQVKQVLWNLFLNACEAMTGKGSLSVVTDLEAVLAKPENTNAKIVVRDTGPGFDEKALPKLFTPFFTTKDGGSGLGLPIVKRITEGLQGKIHGRNHPQGGAEVVMTLPLFFRSTPM
jgi:two-component system sensor histidine kinase PilS (NtrC family)